MEEFFQIGIIVNTHGLQGEVKVLPTTDEPRRFEILDKVWLFKDDKLLTTLRIDKVRYFKQYIILKFKQLNTIELVEGYKKTSLQIPRSLALPLYEDEYYVADLIGVEVFAEDKKLGNIKEVLFTGSNDVYVVEDENNKQILIPAIKECILDVDLQNKRMNVHLMKGLI